MSDFVTKLQLAEKAMEDIYFEKVNRDLIETLHREAEKKKSVTGSATSATATKDNRG